MADKIENTQVEQVSLWNKEVGKINTDYTETSDSAKKVEEKWNIEATKSKNEAAELLKKITGEQENKKELQETPGNTKWQIIDQKTSQAIDALNRPEAAEGIKESYQNTENEIANSSNDKNRVARQLGKAMKYIIGQ